ncbi:MAG TPA: DUF6438 domain-containing protein [Rhizomicrobium sp.]
MRPILSAFLIALALCAAAPAIAAEAPRLQGPGHKLPHGGRPPQRVAFPAIRDWSTLKITLSRSMCFGRCPSYRVAIDGDGHVSWLGEANVFVQGPAGGRISQAQVRRLDEAFRKANCFGRYYAYRAPITDLPEYRVGISYDGHKMEVLDYMGQGVGMPRAVSDLERLIDKTANTARWIKGP